MLKHKNSWMGGFVAACCTLAVPALAQAAEDAAEAALHASFGMVSLAVAIGIGLAAIGGALGQARAAAAALEGVARNPNAADKVLVPLILSLAFIESLVLFTWVLMYVMLNKVG